MPKIAKLGLAGIVIAAVSLANSETIAGDRQVVFSGGGGAYEKTLKKYWFEPFTKATGIKVIYVSTANTAERRTQVQAMLKTNNVTWDLFQEGEMDAEAPEHLARVEDISEFCQQFADRKDLSSGACKPSGVLFGQGATLLAYNKEKFSNGGPKTWADFWDTKGFPGPRALPSFPDAWRNLTIALIADGVPHDKLYPLDVDRAFKKLDELKSNVGLWWSTGDQTVQGFRSGEYDTSLMWLTRATALKNDSQPIEWSYDGALLVGDRFGLIQGAPNRKAALELLKYFLDTPEVQAGICEALTCTPPSTDAIAFISEDVRARMPSAEAIKTQMVVPDAAWINKNKPMLVERWNAWIQQ